MVAGSDDWRIEDGDQFVRVALHGRLDDAGDVDRLLKAVDAALTRTAFEREAVRDTMWTWASDRMLAAVAVVVDGEMTRVRTNMTALSRKVRMRAFLDESDAVQWMHNPGRRTREIPQA